LTFVDMLPGIVVDPFGFSTPGLSEVRNLQSSSVHVWPSMLLMKKL